MAKLTTDETFFLRVAEECREYAERYSCSLEDSLADWEGDGPSGSWGLNSWEKDQVRLVLRAT